MVGQMLYEHATTLSAAAIGNRSRRMMNVRKILDTTTWVDALCAFKAAPPVAIGMVKLGWDAVTVGAAAPNMLSGGKTAR